jgi:ankyrin repeat domain-containing protein 13
MTIPAFALHSLIFENKPNELKANLHSKIDINANFRSQTPLTLAIQLGRKDCVKILLEAGCSTLARNKLGWTPFHEAVSLGDREIIKVDYMVDIDGLQGKESRIC